MAVLALPRAQFCDHDEPVDGRFFDAPLGRVKPQLHHISGFKRKFARRESQRQPISIGPNARDHPMGDRLGITRVEHGSQLFLNVGARTLTCRSLRFPCLIVAVRIVVGQSKAGRELARRDLFPLDPRRLFSISAIAELVTRNRRQF
jgi:hypothetical protein